ncbi:MAG: glycosyltransferase family 2 protein [Eubacteriales bacterium]|nr:glycosyltransferase family 2 protein [Eubacteriales bacterium]
MLTNSEFAKQDFLTDDSHFGQAGHIRSVLVKGDENVKPFISIAIPTYKRAHLLKEAIESCLNQKDYRDFNIVITDNDPTRGNETEGVIENIHSDKILYYKNEENIGALANFNRCIEMSTGKYAVMLNTDDLLADDYLKKLNGLLVRYPTADVMLPDIDIEIDGKIKRQKAYQSLMRKISRFADLDRTAIRLNINDFILYNPAGSPSGVAYRRESFLASQGFNPKWHPTGDKVLYINLSLKNQVYLTSINAGRYRFLDNITQESGMRTLFVSQGIHINRYLSKRLNKKWINRYYKGATYYRLNRPSNKKFGIEPDKESINGLFETQPNILDFMFFSLIWLIALKCWFFRVLAAAFRTYLRGAK